MTYNNVEIVAHSADPERLVAAAARSCWSRRPFREIYAELTDSQIDRILRKVILRGHHSVLEHADFTFAITSVSRVLTHQLVRHRIASYSQLSQQRVNQARAEYIIPPAIRHDPDLTRRFRDWMDEAANFYEFLVERGVPRGTARYVLPSACETKILMTMNARSLFNLIGQRDCGAEEWEFRALAHQMHSLLLGLAPRIFRFAGPKCTTEGVCTEGDLADHCPKSARTGASVLFRESELQPV